MGIPLAAGFDRRVLIFRFLPASATQRTAASRRLRRSRFLGAGFVLTRRGFLRRGPLPAPRKQAKKFVRRAIFALLRGAA